MTDLMVAHRQCGVRIRSTQENACLMNTALLELAKHNTWATNTLIDFCAELEPGVLDWTSPGTYGTVLRTLQHLVDAETGYVVRLLQRERPTDWLEESNAGLPAIRLKANEVGEELLAFLATDWDTEALGLGHGDDGVVFEIRSTIFLTQLIHHGNEHRAHVCTVIGAHGVEPPEVSAWGFAEPAGRAWVQGEQPGA